jgi:protein required for attachment to host cells
MTQSIVAVIDGTNARFFTLEQAEVPEYQSGPNLVEKLSLSNEANELHGKDLWSSTKTGRNRGVGSRAHGYDDGRQSHLDEFERNFAKEIVNKIVELTQSYRAHQLILIAEPKILGTVRDAIASHIPKDLKIQELAKDLCKLKPLELHQYLADKELLPARKIVSR